MTKVEVSRHLIDPTERLLTHSLHHDFSGVNASWLWHVLAYLAMNGQEQAMRKADRKV